MSRKSWSSFRILISIILLTSSFMLFIGHVEGQDSMFDREEQWFQFHDSPEIIEDGIYHDHVDERKLSYPDRHYYLIDVERNTVLSISIEKVDNGTGVLYLDTEIWRDDYYSESEMMFITLDKQGENFSDEWTNREMKDVKILIEVEGVGEYTMVVDTSDDAGLNPDILMPFFTLFFLIIMMVFSICLSMIYPLTMMVIIIIVIVIVIKGNQKKRKPPVKKKKKVPKKKTTEPSG